MQNRKLLVCLSCIVIGIVVAFLLLGKQQLPSTTPSYTPIDWSTSQLNANYSAWEIFIKICFSNFIVGFLLSVVGFLTGGFITCLTIIVNSMNVSILIITSYRTGITIPDILHMTVFHGVFEIIAFIWLAIIGLGGYNFYSEIMRNGFTIQMLPSCRILIIPNLIILFAAVIEIVYGLINNLV